MAFFSHSHLAPPGHRLPWWRADEDLVPAVEEIVNAPKAWELIRALTPDNRRYVEAYEAELDFVPPVPKLPSRFTNRAMFIRAHSEDNGDCFISLFVGTTVLRRGHIIGEYNPESTGHQDPGGHFTEGAHVHLPTTRYHNIDSPGARTRAFAWGVPPDIDLLEAVKRFGTLVCVVGQPSIQDILKRR